VPGVYDYAGSEDGLATFAPVPVLPSLYVHKVGTPDSLFEALYPSPLFPSAYASTTGSRPPPQDWRPGGSLLLSCRTLSFPTACRFIPALGHCGPLSAIFPFKTKQDCPLSDNPHDHSAQAASHPRDVEDTAEPCCL